MKRKNEILKEMATVINGNDGSSFETIVLVYPNVYDLCEENFSDCHGEASRATYFGNISDWLAQCRLNLEGNIETISDEVLEYEIENLKEEILDEYFSAYGDDELYKKYKEAWNG